MGDVLVEPTMETTNELQPSTATMAEDYQYYACNTTLQNMSAYELFGLVIPNSQLENWEERTTAYWVFFYLMLIVYGILFLVLGLTCILLLAKKHLAQRFRRLRTFVAIDLALMILGFSRVLKIIVDPWAQSGFCDHYACIVVSRLLGAFAFPSLTASYTLVFITLWMSAKIQLGYSNFQKLKVLLPLCFLHYGVAVVFEIVASIPISNSILVVILLVTCEAFFSVWGFLVCFSFLFAGYRLIKSLEKSARSSSMICKDSPSMTRQQLIENSKFANRGSKSRQQSNLKLKHMLRDRHKRAIRKIIIITYITVALGMLYSTVSVINLTLMCLSLFNDCPGFIFGSRQHPAVWLTIRYIVFTLELLLAMLLTYSVNDYQPVVKFLKNCMTSLCRLSKIGSKRQSPSEIELPNINSSNMFSSENSNTPKLSPITLSAPSPLEKCEVDTTEEKSEGSFELSLPNSSSPSPTSSPPVSPPPSSPKTVRIMEFDESPSVHAKKNTPKHPSPLTVSFSVNDDELKESV